MHCTPWIIKGEAYGILHFQRKPFSLLLSEGELKGVPADNMNAGVWI